MSHNVRGVVKSASRHPAKACLVVLIFLVCALLVATQALLVARQTVVRREQRVLDQLRRFDPHPGRALLTGHVTAISLFSRPARQTSDKEIVLLKQFTRLRLLALQGSNITDEGLAHLKDIPSLRSLTFQDCPNITDRGLVHLKKLTNLRVLHVAGTQVTSKALYELGETMPNCEVSGYGPSAERHGE